MSIKKKKQYLSLSDSQNLKDKTIWEMEFK